jgi:hypothetical protein
MNSVRVPTWKKEKLGVQLFPTPPPVKLTSTGGHTEPATATPHWMLPPAPGKCELMILLAASL